MPIYRKSLVSIRFRRTEEKWLWMFKAKDRWCFFNCCLEINQTLRLGKRDWAKDQAV